MYSNKKKIKADCWFWSDIKTEDYKNQYVYFKRNVQIDGEINNANICISVDTNYALWINDTFVDCGQYLSYPHIKFYDNIDVKKYLKNGDNTIIILAYYQGLDSASYVSGKPGIFAQVTVNNTCYSGSAGWCCSYETGYVNVKYKAEDVRGKTEELSLTAARKAVTLVRDRNNILPLDKNKIKKVSIIVSTHHDAFYDRDIQYLKNELEKRGIEVYMQRRLKNGIELKEISDNSDLIIYAAFVNGHMPKGTPTLVQEECETYFHAFTYGKEKSIGISCSSPYLEHDIMDNANACVNLYGHSPFLLQAFVEAIFGEIPFVGKSPVNLKPPKFVYED